MAENETAIAVPEDTNEAAAVLTGAVQGTGQATSEHIEPGLVTTEPQATADAPAQPADGGPVVPDGSVVNTHDAPLVAGEGGTITPLGSVVNTHN